MVTGGAVVGGAVVGGAVVGGAVVGGVVGTGHESHPFPSALTDPLANISVNAAAAAAKITFR